MDEQPIRIPGKLVGLLSAGLTATVIGQLDPTLWVPVLAGGGAALAGGYGLVRHRPAIQQQATRLLTQVTRLQLPAPVDDAAASSALSITGRLVQVARDALPIAYARPAAPPVPVPAPRAVPAAPADDLLGALLTDAVPPVAPLAVAGLPPVTFVPDLAAQWVGQWLAEVNLTRLRPWPTRSPKAVLGAVDTTWDGVERLLVALPDDQWQTPGTLALVLARCATTPSVPWLRTVRDQVGAAVPLQLSSGPAVLLVIAERTARATRPLPVVARPAEIDGTTNTPSDVDDLTPAGDAALRDDAADAGVAVPDLLPVLRRGTAREQALGDRHAAALAALPVAPPLTDLFRRGTLRDGLVLPIGLVVSPDDLQPRLFGFDLEKLTHLLWLAKSGVGKDGAITGWLFGLLLHHGPERVQIALADPKNNDYGFLAQMPHCIGAAHTPATIAALFAEVNAVVVFRGAVIATAIPTGSGTVAEFNALPEAERRAAWQSVADRWTQQGGHVPRGSADATMSRIVFVVTEANVVMASNGGDPNQVGVISMGRSSGVHCIITAQRPQGLSWLRAQAAVVGCGRLRSPDDARLALEADPQTLPYSPTACPEPVADDPATLGLFVVQTDEATLLCRTFYLGRADRDAAFAYLRTRYRTAPTHRVAPDRAAAPQTLLDAPKSAVVPPSVLVPGALPRPTQGAVDAPLDAAAITPATPAAMTVAHDETTLTPLDWPIAAQPQVTAIWHRPSVAAVRMAVRAAGYPLPWIGATLADLDQLLATPPVRLAVRLAREEQVSQNALAVLLVGRKGTASTAIGRMLAHSEGEAEGGSQ